ncbi:hypothetical protein SAMN06296386_109113 [Lachnospiraceae bacterium]|nr:hypothetical protein SAMN06296386_109113 [Lachnospiraceae bacterium]
MTYENLIRKSTDLDSLFELWEKKAQVTERYMVNNIEHEVVINHADNKFIPDGIVNADLWHDSKHKKILYVLKEAYTDENEKAFDLAKWLRDYHPNLRIWNRIARWTYGIQNTSANRVAKYIPDIDKKEEIRKQLFEQIAVLNLKKSGGKSQSVTEEIAAYARSDREEIVRELQLIDPDIVICGLTYWILDQVVFGNKPLGGASTCDNWYYYKNLDGKERLYIDYYHPANRWPDLLNYYAVINIYQQALLSKISEI